jgi:anaerobic selenocysteine-containing dehydrogenase
MVLPSALLHERIPQLFVVLHPDDAGRFNVKAGSTAQVSLGSGQEFTAEVRLDPSMPAGYLLAPRSLGVALETPTPVSRLRAAEPARARS